MAIRPIRILGDPILRAHCTQVRFPLERGERKLIADLRDTLTDFRRRSGFGRGIAAPQIGVAKKVIYVNTLGAMINPRIVKRSRSEFALWDDCFSFPDLLVKVRRHRSVTVHYIDEHGISQMIAARNDISELMQHEIDHINGVLAIDRAIDTRSIVLRSEFLKLARSKR